MTWANGVINTVNGANLVNWMNGRKRGKFGQRDDDAKRMYYLLKLLLKGTILSDNNYLNKN